MCTMIPAEAEIDPPTDPSCYMFQEGTGGKYCMRVEGGAQSGPYNMV